MKKNDWIFALSVLVFSIIFWKQRPGLNFLIMNSILISGSVLMDGKLLRNRNWLISAMGALISSMCVFYYGDRVSLGANFVSLLMMSAYSMSPRNSVILSVFQSFCSVCASFAFMITDGIERRQKMAEEKSREGIPWKRVVITMTAIVVMILFFMMYRQSSVLFYNLTQKIDLSFISPAWIGFTIAGSLVFYGFYYHHSIEPLSTWEARMPGYVVPAENPSWFDTLMSVSSEKFAAILLLSLLNVLLLVVNFLDVTFIFGGVATLPPGVTFSAYVHQGIGMIILSIVMAMCIILYFFRGRMNFENRSGVLRTLAIGWIVQNAVMIISTCWRNGLYIESYGLTYKRLGVYIYLVLALFGVITIAWKVIWKSSNAFLFRVNSWFGFTLLILSCCVNWDLYITKFNLTQKQPFDMQYFTSLSSRNYGVLLAHLDKYPDAVPDGRFNTRLYRFMNDQRYIYDHHKWPSSVRTSETLFDQWSTRSISAGNWNADLYLDDQEIRELHYFPLFENTHRLFVNDGELTTLGEIGKFRNVVRLEAAGNELESISGIEKLPQLRYISFDARKVKDLDVLLKCSALKEVSIEHLPDEMRSTLQRKFPGIIITENNCWDRLL